MMTVILWGDAMEMFNRRYARLLSILIAIWFIAVIWASALEAFKRERALPGIAFLLPLVVFGLWMWLSAGFRRFILSADVRTLTYLQSWRVVGFALVLAGEYKILPDVFARSAGWGDLAIGFTAPLAAMYMTNPERRPWMIVWQVLGILDLVTAVATAALATAQAQAIGGGISMQPMMMLPLSLIPTFGVPLALMVHIVCIAKLTRRDQASTVRAGYGKTVLSS
jgi:hypothetical protein